MESINQPTRVRRNILNTNCKDGLLFWFRQCLNEIIEKYITQRKYKFRSEFRSSCDGSYWIDFFERSSIETPHGLVQSGKSGSHTVSLPDFAGKFFYLLPEFLSDIARAVFQDFCFCRILPGQIGKNVWRPLFACPISHSGLVDSHFFLVSEPNSIL